MPTATQFIKTKPKASERNTRAKGLIMLKGSAICKFQRSEICLRIQSVSVEFCIETINTISILLVSTHISLQSHTSSLIEIESLYTIKLESKETRMKI
jgi:hypothetical protein